jgi:hypothetical protein
LKAAWSAQGDVKSLQLRQKTKAVVTSAQVAGTTASDDEGQESEDDDDVLAAVSRRLGRYQKKVRPWVKAEVERLTELYGRWHGVAEHTQAQLISRDLLDRPAEAVTKQLGRLRLSAKGKQPFKRLEVGSVADAPPPPLMADVERCLGRLRKGLSAITLEAGAFAAGVDWAVAQLRGAAGSKAEGTDYALVPLTKDDWRQLDIQWLQQALLVAGCDAPRPEGSPHLGRLRKGSPFGASRRRSAASRWRRCGPRTPARPHPHARNATAHNATARNATARNATPRRVLEPRRTGALTLPRMLRPELAVAPCTWHTCPVGNSSHGLPGHAPPPWDQP